MQKNKNILSAIVCVCIMVCCLGVASIIPNGIVRAEGEEPVIITSGNWLDEGNYSTSLTGSGTETDPYLVYTANDLAYIATLPKNQITMYYKQMEDIDLIQHYWTPIEYGYLKYDGNNKTISNMKINLLNGMDNFSTYEDGFGFVKILDVYWNTTLNNGSGGNVYGEVQNLNFENAKIIDQRTDDAIEKSSGIVAGKNLGKISNCNVQGMVESVRAGGITGYNATKGESSADLNVFGNIQNCSAVVQILAKTHAGGIAGINQGGIKNCRVKDSNIVGVISVGGIAGTSGTTHDTIRKHSNIKQSYVYTDSSATSVLADVSATISSSDKSCGGLVGVNYSEVSECMTDGVLVGVKVTYSEFGATEINNNIDNGGADYVSNNAGGLIGKNDGDVSNTYSKTAEYDAACVVGEYAGGLVGRNTSNGAIKNSYAVQRVWGSYQGGIIGRNDNTDTSAFENVFYSADVSDYNRFVKKTVDNEQVVEPFVMTSIGSGTEVNSITSKKSYEMTYKGNASSVLLKQVINGNTDWISGWTGATSSTTNLYVYPILKFISENGDYANAGATNLEGKVPMPWDKFYSLSFQLGTSGVPTGANRINISDFKNKEYSNAVSHHIKRPDAEIYAKMGIEDVQYKYQIVWYYGSSNNIQLQDGEEYGNKTYKAFSKKTQFNIEYYLWNDGTQEYDLIQGRDERLKNREIYQAGGNTLDNIYTYESTTFKVPYLNYKDTDEYEKGLNVVWRIAEDDDTVFDNNGSLKGKIVHNFNNKVYSKSADKTIKLYGKIEKAVYSVQLNVNGYKDTTFYTTPTTTNRVSGGEFMLDATTLASTTMIISDSIVYGEEFDLSIYDGKELKIKNIILGTVEWAFCGFGIMGTKTLITGPDMKNLAGKVWDYAVPYTSLNKNNVYKTENGETIIQLYAIYTTKIKNVKFYATIDIEGEYTQLDNNLTVDYNTTLDATKMPNTESNNFLTPIGMNFKSWYYKVGDEKVEFDVSKPVMSDLELYADYNFKKHKISFDKNDNDATMTYADTIEVEYTGVIGQELLSQLFQDVVIRESWLPTKPGWICTGWYLDEKGTKPVFLIKGENYEISAAAKMPNENKTLYAGWRPKEFKLSLNPNGGKVGTTELVDIKYEQNIVDVLDALSGDKLPTKTNMGQVAWTLDPNDKFDTQTKVMGTDNFITATGTEVDVNGTVMNIGQFMPDLGPEGTILTVYAVWRNSCKVILDAGSGVFPGVSKEQKTMVLNLWQWEKVKDGKAGFRLSDYSPTLEGFLFKGWYTVGKEDTINDASVEFTDDYNIGANLQITVKAKWGIDPEATYIKPDNTQSIIITLICVGAIVVALGVSLFFHAKSKDGYVNEKQFQRIQSAKGRFSYNPHDKSAIEKRNQELDERINSRDE